MTKAEIQFVRSLSDKRVRDAERLFIAEGDKLIGEILQSNLKVRHLYALEGHFDGRAERVSEKEMERISQLKTASTSLAVVEQPHHKSVKSAPAGALSLALDGVQNPGNLGTIIRLADWFGVEDIICSRDTADCFNPKVIQATMGAILRVRVHYTDNLPALLQEAHREGLNIYGTLLDGGNIYDERLASSGIIVMGNEGRGITDETRKTLTHRLLIPPYPADAPTSESLNVAMATGIILAEFRRQQR